MRTRLFGLLLMALVLVAVGCAAESSDFASSPAVESTTSLDPPPPDTVPPPEEPADPPPTAVEHDDLQVLMSEPALATGGSPLPDRAGAVDGDDGSGPLPLGSVTTLPDSVQVDFLFEFCWGPCFRDGHFMDPDNPGVGSGPFTSDTPFHVRHGFVNNSDEPLGDGFDVVIYVTPLDMPGEFGGLSIGETRRYTSDYVVRGTSDQCGPTYGSQTGPETCEWFVHEFNDGLPEGRHALWAEWEAPCSAWVDYGYTDTCTDPNEVLSLFSSGFDSPFGPFPPDYTEHNEANQR
jgi:hypothetical protein